MLSALAELFIVMVEKGGENICRYLPAYTKIPQKILQKAHNIKTLCCHTSYGMVLTYI